MRHSKQLAKLVEPVTPTDVVVLVGILRAFTERKETRGTRMLAKLMLRKLQGADEEAALER